MFRQPFSSIGNFLVEDILRLTHHRLVARYSKILATFLVSGLLHLAVDLALGMSLAESGSVRFFCTQALGIAVEDGVQAIHRAVYDGGRGTVSDQPRAWARVVGYVWVVVFLAWSTPVWVYPAIRMNNGGVDDRILPFSVLRMLLGRV
jgi:Membrane bound O-acyl transferase family